MPSIKVTDIPQQSSSAWQVFLVFLRLGLTSFGGPVAHIGYFREEFVVRRGWLGERSYTDLVALCQFLPGPASSQVGLALGLARAGYSGALAAWLGFTLPSAIAMMLLALGISSWGEEIPTGLLQGLKVAAVAVVAHAVWGMARSLCTDTLRISIMTAVACMVLMWPGTLSQLGAIIVAGIAGWWLIKPTQEIAHEALSIRVSRRTGAILLAIFFTLLVSLPLLAQASHNPGMSMLDVFYRVGALVFGGGHVILPLLQAEVVPNGWVSNEIFLAGYGAAQAMPGPLFTFAAFLGASMSTPPTGFIGGTLCLVAIFVPSFLIVVGALPFWEQLRTSLRMRAALAGVNAAVVGLLLAALYHPVWTSAIHQSSDFALAVVALTALVFWKLRPWLVVVGSGLGGWLLSLPW
ncbi:chromate efflux transporter [Candidimonas sp. SYP-B2681]|uniref:chromate efflux transporter n=1 Tax=Candidimonas sp. SYP-B2681 TaxID=2497686 RepID=UPI000F88E5E8|nr:chromate efflux transporter [Candidimonas sp. SYP-B2681]RTZ41086.1 chromate efflux transporter [Candidimonas sp. SYP-B2681]